MNEKRGPTKPLVEPKMERLQCPGASSSLAALRPGEEAVVLAVEGSFGERLRMLELGLVQGTRLRVERKAPLGGPIQLSLRGYSLTLRASQARAIAVERCPSSPRPPRVQLPVLTS